MKPRSLVVRWSIALMWGFLATSLLGAETESGIRVENFQLLPNDAFFKDYFGNSVALSGDRVLIGAQGDDDNGVNSGAVYVFERGETGWNEAVQLLADDGDAGDGFGKVVSLSGETALVGAPAHDGEGTHVGAAYAFVSKDGRWIEQARLLPSDGMMVDNFGWAVALSGDTALVGAPSTDDNGSESGSVYVFQRLGSVWIESAKLVPADGSAGDFFGISLAFSGDTAVVGAYRDDDNGADSGSAYIFVKERGTWTEKAKLVASDGASGDYFGTSVSISDGVALIGAVFDDEDGPLSGAAYVFEIREGAWVEWIKIRPEDGSGDKLFGFSVAIDAHTALVGAAGDDENGEHSGSVYLFERRGGRWSQRRSCCRAWEGPVTCSAIPSRSKDT